MNILVIGNGGREDAICRKLHESKKIGTLHCAPGNGGTLRYAQNAPISVEDTSAIVDYAKKHDIQLCIIGPEVPLCNGLADTLWENGIQAFGPQKSPARLEGSKDFAKEFMKKYHLPTAKYIAADNKKDAQLALDSFSYPLVIKADGLCAGKGVKICTKATEAHEYLSQLFDDAIFGAEGSKVVIEEYLTGIEASLLCFVTKNGIIHLESAKDYKRIYEGDQGDNTGGVGCYSPSPLFDASLKEKLHTLTDTIFEGLQKENILYTGILFIGLMIENGNPNILEFNVRFGDPETEVVLPRLESDFIELLEKALDGSLTEKDFVWTQKKCLTVILTSAGYPNSYEKGKEITGLDTVDKDIYVYHNNTKMLDDKLLSDGGRVLSVTGLGDSFEEIREKIYQNIEKIHFENKQFRKDIGLF